jgi:hypothetical protein
MPMGKSYTLLFSIHGLASQACTEIVKKDEFFLEDEFNDVFENLNTLHLEDAKQETVDKIMRFARHHK